MFYKSVYNNSKLRKHAALWSWKNTVVGYGDDISYQWNDTVINIHLKSNASLLEH
jgi:hypothetical protein